MTTKRITSFSRPRVTVVPWEGTALVSVDARFALTMLRDIEARKATNFYPDHAAFVVGYDTVCKAQEALLMDIGERLIMEVRALRGVDDDHPEIYDPASDPFSLSLGTVMDGTRATDNATAKLEEIRLLLESMSGGEDMEEVLDLLGQAVVLLG